MEKKVLKIEVGLDEDELNGKVQDVGVNFKQYENVK